MNNAPRRKSLISSQRRAALQQPSSIAPLRQKLPLRLRELRERHGLSEYTVAAGIGVRQPTYHLIETGRTALSLARLMGLADFYGYPLALLARGYRVTAAEELTVRAYAELRGPLAPAAEVETPSASEASRAS